MIVAAIYNGMLASDIFGDQLDVYRDIVFRVLSGLREPVRVILWNQTIQSDTILDKIVYKNDIFGNYSVEGDDPCPEVFLSVLSKEKNPVELYLFTNGIIDDSKCEPRVSLANISRAHLHFIGFKKHINTKFIQLFRHIPLEISNKGKRICEIPTKPLNFDLVDQAFIMKDETFKACVASELLKPDVDARNLKVRVYNLLKNVSRGGEKLSIETFFKDRDVEGCCAYIKKHDFKHDEYAFREKTSNILELFYRGDPFRRVLFEPVREVPPSPGYLHPEEMQILSREDVEGSVACIPLRYRYRRFPIENPFQILASKERIEEFLYRVGSRIEYHDRYDDSIGDAYVLYQPNLDEDRLLRHNNCVLSRFFQNCLPGCSVLWHVVFLYVLATRSFRLHRDIFFGEIRRLGERHSYFVSLTPHNVPRIVEPLRTCFWFVACVAPVVWANDARNALRSSTTAIVDFYQDVYDPLYRPPEKIATWRLWTELCRNQTTIFGVLSRYFRHDRAGPEGFGIVVYRDKIEPPPDDGLDAVLDLYNKFKQYAHPETHENLDEVPRAEVPLFYEEESDDKLSHVRINLDTCCPYVRCPVTKKHWRECVGKYDLMKQSYLRLFKRFCIKEERYPKSAEELMCFLNEYVFKCKNKIPELFHSKLPNQMKRVMDIFEDVMKVYTCREYLDKCREMSSSEEKRLEKEETEL